ncbi:MAG: ASCH domain-containing protein [Treponema sp.]|nr:ASCH domain-containing protein [Treponema sp.]
MTISEYWAKFLEKTGVNADEAVFSGELCFENTGAVGMTQLALVLSGKKTAMFSAFNSFSVTHTPLPVTGEQYIVEDADGEPKGIIEITSVQVVPFRDVTWAMAALEGEDSDLESWREKQREYLSEDADFGGFSFTEESKLVFEVFRLIYR